MVNLQLMLNITQVYNGLFTNCTKHILSSLIDHPLRLFIFFYYFFKSNCELSHLDYDSAMSYTENIVFYYLNYFYLTFSSSDIIKQKSTYYFCCHHLYLICNSLFMNLFYINVIFKYTTDLKVPNFNKLYND